jgi:hypothetical protein
MIFTKHSSCCPDSTASPIMQNVRSKNLDQPGSNGPSG